MFATRAASPVADLAVGVETCGVDEEKLELTVQADRPDGTPVLDVSHVPYCAFPDARAGWVDELDGGRPAAGPPTHDDNVWDVVVCSRTSSGS